MLDAPRQLLRAFMPSKVLADRLGIHLSKLCIWGNRAPC